MNNIKLDIQELDRKAPILFRKWSVGQLAGTLKFVGEISVSLEMGGIS